MTAQPRDKLVGFASTGRIERCHIFPRRYPVYVGTPVEQVLGGAQLPTMTGPPEGTFDLVGSRHRCVRKRFLEAINESKGRCVLERGLCPALDQAVGRLPLPKGSSVCKWSASADDPTQRLNISTGVKQRIQGRDVITTGSPVERCFTEIGRAHV